MHRILSLHGQPSYLFPIISAFAVLVTLPPFNLWPLIFVALVPMYVFIFQEKNIRRFFTGTLFFGLVFSGFLSFMVFSGFTWIPEAYLFSNSFKLLAVPVVLFISTGTALVMYLFKALMPMPRTSFRRAMLFGILFAVVELIIGNVLIGFNYGSLAYAASHISALRFVASIGGMFLVTFAVAFGNAALAEALWFLFQEKKRGSTLLIPLGIFITIIIISLTYQRTSPVISVAMPPSISVAIIQDSTRKKGEAFGTVVQGSFQFPLLEKRVKEALALHPDIIIYPFSPWTGVIADTLDNSDFTKDVVGMDFAIFKKWLTAHLPPETTLVTWDTRLEGEKYWSEIDFWRNGMLVGSYKKTKLFPFFDYTPRWAGRLGIYSTPYDGTAGTSTSPITIGKAVIGNLVGNLVCSEVSRPDSARENGKDADVLFAIGSEAMFTGPLASEFNLLNTQLRAVESGRYIIRANKFGSSALIDPYGNIIKEMAHNQSGILFMEVPIQTEHRTTPYSAVTEYPFLILLVGYALFLWSKKSEN